MCQRPHAPLPVPNARTPGHLQVRPPHGLTPHPHPSPVLPSHPTERRWPPQHFDSATYIRTRQWNQLAANFDGLFIINLYTLNAL